MKKALEVAFLLLRVLQVFLVSMLSWFLPPKYKSVEGEVCLVTGAGSGIGRLIALEFAKRGAILVLWDVNEKGNQETAEMIKEIGGKVFAQTCDVSNREEVYKVAESAKAAAGNITILVNNAGIVYGKDFMDMADEHIERTMKVNCSAHFWTTKAFLPGMMESNHGHIVAISSVMGFLSCSGMATYAASKHAVIGFCESLEMELRSKKFNGIKMTVVCPTAVTTGMFSGVGAQLRSIDPAIEPRECVDSIMHAVLTNRPAVTIPRSMYVFHTLTTCMPREALLRMLDFTGYLESMQTFIPTRDYQIEAAAK